MKIQRRLSEISDRGYQHIAMTADKPRRLQRLIAKREIGYPVVIDPDGAVMQAYGVYNRKAITRGHIPHPAVACIAADGTLSHVQTRESMIGRLGVDEILTFIGGS